MSNERPRFEKVLISLPADLVEALEEEVQRTHEDRTVILRAILRKWNEQRREGATNGN